MQWQLKGVTSVMDCDTTPSKEWRQIVLPVAAGTHLEQLMYPDTSSSGEPTMGQHVCIMLQDLSASSRTQSGICGTLAAENRFACS
jgi:hypothetical protein